MIDLQKLKADLENDEGCINEVYLDHLGYPTFGIGHLIRDTDPEYGCDVGQEITKEREFSGSPAGIPGFEPDDDVEQVRVAPTQEVPYLKRTPIGRKPRKSPQTRIINKK